MDGLSSLALLQIGAQFGIAGLVLVLWFLTDRSKERLIQQYREDTQAALELQKQHMAEIRRMYESNVRLVEAYESVAKDLRDVVIVNTQIMQEVRDDVRNNQYCPHVRLEKRAGGPT